MPRHRTTKRLLAVSHEASQTGAPLVLLSFLSWLRQHSTIEIHTLLVDDGPLRRRFEAVGTVSAVDDLPGAPMLGVVERGLRHRGKLGASNRVAGLRYRPALARLGTFDHVYLNSLTTLDLLPFLRGAPRVAAHIHEGPVTVGEATRLRRSMADRRLPDRWVAVSHDTAAAIEEAFSVPPATVGLHHPFIDVASVRSAPLTASRREDLRRSLGIPPDAAVVIGSGTIDRRKGPDLFVQLANHVRTRRRPGDRPVHFVWVGGHLEGPDWPMLRADIERSGAANVQVIGHVPDPRPYFQLADVFALTSREDPFPLVCLEHGALGVPVVAYSSSGIRTLLRAAGPEAAGGVIDYLDVAAMAEHVMRLLGDRSLAGKVGRQLADAVEARHDVGIVAPAIARFVGLVAESPPARAVDGS